MKKRDPPSLTPPPQAEDPPEQYQTPSSSLSSSSSSSSSSSDDDRDFGAWSSQALKPFAAFGSFRHKHGDVFGDLMSHSSRCKTAPRLGRSGLSAEAPAKLESSLNRARDVMALAGMLSAEVANYRTDRHGNAAGICSDDLTAMEGKSTLDSPTRALPVYISHDKAALIESKLHHRSLQQLKARSFSTDLDREEAWERKRELYLPEDDEIDVGEDDDGDDGAYEADSEDLSGYVNDDVASDPGEASKRVPGFRKKAWQRPHAKHLPRTRTRSLTDEDMEELRGSIDLGFGFSYDESCNLKSTLPALELYYAINRNLVDSKGRSSPVSPLDGNVLLRTSSAGSAGSPLNDNWRVSSPGDHPSQVKTRLRHWAQAVACSIKQGY